ncbi:hypothetical protein [Rhodococcus erythropolis]|uniref:hypothetical protein n=1 Tax=Rhodococcus erythropolis TaxID=1833 RepID=UPI00038E4BDE|nr:hypothetical protein [Rhodococcus erythropolis]EQM34292.1 hypothetical protein N601_06495 [Rhodococcus erythropolis DN1]
MNSTSSPGSRSGLPGRLKRPRLYEQLAEHISNFIELKVFRPAIGFLPNAAWLPNSA